MSSKVKIDLFYSSVDYASQKAREELDALQREVPPKLIVREDHDFLDPKTKDIANTFDVKFVPTVVLNETEILSGPSKSALKEKIQ